MKLKSWCIAIMLLLVATTANAGVFGTIGGYIEGKALSLLIGAGIGALGMFGATWKLTGKAVKELGDFVWAIYEATREDSAGGRQIVSKEMEKVLKEGAEIYPAVSKAIASRKK